jgi:Pyruvate/2-oxoacid:ferredoxin oxidoreductase delta subunit
MPVLRNIVRIDQAKCNGCGLCVTACAEGAIQIVDGKAKLVKDQYCDGLGACLGECPEDAITIEQREADAFDEVAVQKHLAGQGTGRAAHAPAVRSTHAAPAPHKHATGGCPGAAAMALGGGCPGSAAKSFGGPAAPAAASGPQTPSQLRNWPLQLKLVSPMAPYLNGANLCIAADCTAFAYPDFHRDMLAGKVLLIACPKLDDVASYAEKLAAIFTHNDVRSVEVIYMEVPCCFGLVHLVRQAIAAGGKPVPLALTKVGLEGGVVERTGP